MNTKATIDSARRARDAAHREAMSLFYVDRDHEEQNTRARRMLEQCRAALMRCIEELEEEDRT